MDGFTICRQWYQWFNKWPVSYYNAYFSLHIYIHGYCL